MLVGCSPENAEVGVGKGTKKSIANVNVPDKMMNSSPNQNTEHIIQKVLICCP